MLDGQDDVFVGDAVQVHGAANGFPGFADPDSYRASLAHLRDGIRPRRLYLGHPYRTTDGTPYGVELDARRRPEPPSTRASRVEARVGRGGPRLPLRGACMESDSPYSPFASVAQDLGYSGDPKPRAVAVLHLDARLPTHPTT